jgi:hypothetical protein
VGKAKAAEMSCNHGRHAMMLAILQSIASPEWKLDVHETSRLNVVGCVGRLALWIMRADWCNSGIASIESSTYMPDEARVLKWFGVHYFSRW